MKKSIVVVGGGTGTFTVLRGLKAYAGTVSIKAIVTMADDGGSNRVLRDEFGLLPTSGIRQAIVALSTDEGLMRELFTYRYLRGKGIAGMTFGNLFMAALADILKSQKRAIEETCELMGIVGEILPVSYKSTRLLATYMDGTEVLGEHLIDEARGNVSKQRIIKLQTVPKARISQEARHALLTANLIVLGPGDLYTNTIANLVIGGVKEAIVRSKARLVFVVNLMNKLGEAYQYRASDFLEDLARYIPRERVDYVLVNSDLDFDPKLLAAYKREGATPVEDDLGEKWGKAEVIRAKFLSDVIPKAQKGDVVKRSMIRHHSKKLARVITGLI